MGTASGPIFKDFCGKTWQEEVPGVGKHRFWPDSTDRHCVSGQSQLLWPLFLLSREGTQRPDAPVPLPARHAHGTQRHFILLIITVFWSVYIDELVPLFKWQPSRSQ